MASVSMTTDLNAPVDQVWSVIGDFGAIDRWHPAVERTDADGSAAGSTRVLHIAGGGAIHERLESIDASERSLTYTILESPLPVREYRSTLRVMGSGRHSIVEWSSSFEPAGAPEPEAVKAIEGIYRAGLDNLERLFGA